MRSIVKLPNFYAEGVLDAGCDEAGRGCYAGPVFAAAVILAETFHHPLLNDSKQVSAANRNILRTYIEEQAIAWCVAMVDVDEIDRLNILKASQKAMHKALDGLQAIPQFISVDGNYFISYKKIPHRCIVKGDGKYAHIAAASILAKTHRDAYMSRLHHSCPQYNWQANKGYGTAAHRSSIELHGLCVHHRKSFKIAPAQLALFEQK